MIEYLWPMLPNRSFLRNSIDCVANKLRRVPGVCNICGAVTTFDCSQKNFREYVECSSCGSRNRQRQITAVLLSEYFQNRNVYQHTDNGYAGSRLTRLYRKLRIKPFVSLKEIPKDLVIWNAETTRSLHKALESHFGSGYISSEYINGDIPSGTLHNGIMHVDMQKTHFKDNSIDYILSGDVLEHMPDPIEALRESYRILKTGGSHIFTVPFYHHRFTIEKRAEILPDGSISYLKKPWFHDDPVRPDEGALVFNVFAPELLMEIEKIGFEAKLLLLHDPFHGIYGSNGIVIVARKSIPPDHARDWIYS